MELAPPAAAERRGVLARIDSFVVGLFGMSALLLAVVNVLLRAVAPQHAIEWGDEVQVYLIVWAVCVSFAAVTAADRHIRADLVVGAMPLPVQRALAVLGDLLGLAMSIALCWLGYLVTYESWDFGDVSTTTLRFPLWIYQASLPVGMALMAVAYVLKLLDHAGLRGRAGP
ncbi:TRAP transporter small permease [Roseomonas sp. HJA6]|uniref:TRAP transporter small permease protein n=1 Tax=Roseomonas alba TaxID=2846776 RepID=A0ABS7A2J6_9PROT|nr:TRAP transporter small permease [Neoroseomonas alba]MBW6396519.1 TRAP transporter small permease [Neoroseomonas alba]